MRIESALTVKNIVYVVAALLLAAVAYAVGSRAQMMPATTAAGQNQLMVARRALANGNGQLALSLFKPLAKAGNAKADYWLADIYSNGVGVGVDEGKAIHYLKAAADKGLVKAEARLGQIYATGDRTVQNFAKAQNWLSKAAMKGNATSELGLGQLYEQGLGVPRNPVAAYAWYENAVLRGNIRAEHLRNHVVAQLAPQALTQAEARAKALNAEIG